MYSVGDKVVCPPHGAGTVTRIEPREVLGRRRDYLTVEIPHDRMTVMVPVENAQRAGLRSIVDAPAIDQVLEILRGTPTTMPEGWTNRFKHNRDKLKTGDILEVAEVVRNLAVRHEGKGLPVVEKQMFRKAAKILASEVMYACGLTEAEASAFLRDVFDQAHGREMADRFEETAPGL